MKNQQKWWLEKDGDGNSIIRFTVTSNGKTGPEWIKFFKDAKYELGFGSCVNNEEILISKNFVPSRNILYNIAVLKSNIVKDSRFSSKRMFKEGKKRGYKKPPLEVACLICEKFTNEEIRSMRLKLIIIMHEAFMDDYQKSYIGLGRELDLNDGFAFVLSAAPKK